MTIRPQTIEKPILSLIAHLVRWRHAGVGLDGIKPRRIPFIKWPGCRVSQFIPRIPPTRNRSINFTSRHLTFQDISIPIATGHQLTEFPLSTPIILIKRRHDFVVFHDFRLHLRRIGGAAEYTSIDSIPQTISSSLAFGSLQIRQMPQISFYQFCGDGIEGYKKLFKNVKAREPRSRTSCSRIGADNFLQMISL